MSITLTVPEGAVCGLYAGVAGDRVYFKAIDPEKAIAPTAVATENGITAYVYEGLEEGLYHYGVSKTGYNALS